MPEQKWYSIQAVTRGRLWATLLLPLMVVSCATSLSGTAALVDGTPVRFAYVDAGASSVCVSGSFNEWSIQSHCMQREGTVWTITIALPAGRWEYGFYVNGNTWQTDPGASLTEDGGFGRANSVLIVE